MKLNLASLAFNMGIEGGGSTPAWGTEMGQGEGYRFSFEDMSDFFTGMVYKAVTDIDHIICPLGKGGNQRADYDFTIASLFDKVYVNGRRVVEASFLLLVVKKIVGDNHVGRRTLKYSPNITYKGIEYNSSCFKAMAKTLGVSEKGAWFIDEINIRNQDELHFAAYVVNAHAPVVFPSNIARKEKMIELIGDGNIKDIQPVDEITGYIKYVSAIRTKPFLLLAGISGSGKSKIVRDLARACWPIDSEERTKKKPCNYELIQVKPNWHDSSELIGYVSRIDGEKFVCGKFLPFIAKAWADLDRPYFLCLDEMNLAPVEQYFAEYLSVIETRKRDGGMIVTDPILDGKEQWYIDLVHMISPDPAIDSQFLTEGISLPPNLVVVGTVNMDETTFTFSRKVLDRAMTIEMNDVDLTSGLGDDIEANLVLEGSQVIGDAAEGKDVYGENKGVCDSVIDYLCEINAEFEGTPFKIGYRARNEFLLYAVNRLLLTKGDDRDAIFRKALDEMTSMKILSRIEGDDQKVRNREGEPLLPKLKEIIIGRVGEGDNEEERPVSVRKIEEMEAKLNHTGFTSFWS